MLVFIDESGLPLPGDPCLRPTLCAVCIPKECSRQVTGVLFNIKKSIYGVPTDPIKLIELKSQKLLRRRIYADAQNGDVPAIRKVKLINEVIEACTNIFSFIKVYAVIMERPPFKPYYFPTYLEKENVALLQRIHRLIQSNSSYADKMANVIFDEKDLHGDMKRAYAYSQYLFTSTEGQSFAKTILETPLFVASQQSPGIQLADLLAGAIRLYHELSISDRTSLDQFETVISKLYHFAKSRTDDLHAPNGERTYYGFYEMPLRLFPRPPIPPHSPSR